MFKKIEKLRKAPEPVRERLVLLVTIVVVAVITLLWFVFSVQSFLSKGLTTASSTPESEITQAGKAPQAPFSGWIKN